MSNTPTSSAQVAEGVALPPLPLERIIERADENEFEDPETGRIGFDRLGFAQSIERDVIAPYAERIRALEAAYDAATSLTGDTINARNAEIAEQAERIRQLERELEAARQVGKHLFNAVAESGEHATQLATKSIDTPEFRVFIDDYDNEASYGSLRKARAALIAYIDGRTAGPTVATQTDPIGEVVRVSKSDGQVTVGLYGKSPKIGALVYAAAPKPQEDA